MEKDPECLDNLALSPEYDALKKQMHTRLFDELKKQGDPRVLGQGDVFDAYTHSKRPGYYEKEMAKKKETK